MRKSVYFLLAAVVLSASCGSSDTVASPATDSPTATPVREDPTPLPTPSEQPEADPTPVEVVVACGPEDTPLVVSYLLNSGRCPSPEQLEELAYIWEQNREFWTDFPAQPAAFVKNNTAPAGAARGEDLIGLSLERARALLGEDDAFPMTLDSGPTQVGTMSLYEFSGGLTLLLVVERDELITRVYTFDLG